MNSLFSRVQTKPAAVPAAAPAVGAADASGGAAGAGAGLGGGSGGDSTNAKKANRCHGCRRKLGLMPLHCRCGHDFCSEHIGSSAHACTFDYKAENTRHLQEKLDMTGLSVKLERI